MPEHYFRLTAPPFHKAPDPSHLFKTPAMEEAIARMEHGARSQEISVLTGDVGVGKTTATRALVDTLAEDFKIVWILNPRLTPTQLLQHLAMRLEIEPSPRGRVQLLDKIQNSIFQLWEQKRPLLILIDEAQLLPFPETFEELRLLTNFQMDGENLFSLILSGQPELHRRLEHPRLRPLNQRIGVRYQLTELDSEQVGDYINTRVAAFGREEAMFTSPAIQKIAEFSRGIPRVINNICSNAMLEGFVREQDPINDDIIYDVAKELGIVEI